MNRILLVALASTGFAYAQRPVTVGFGYTPAAQRSAGGPRQVNSQINAAFARTRQTFNNSFSRSPVNLRRVFNSRVTYNTDASSRTQLLRLRGNRGSTLSALRQRRLRSNADILNLYCGINGGQRAGLADNPGAFAVINRNVLSGRGATNRFEPARQLAKNFRAQDQFGQCMAGNRRTVTVTSECGSRRRIPNISNPGRRVGGVPTGTRGNNNSIRVRRETPIRERQTPRGSR